MYTILPDGTVERVQTQDENGKDLHILQIVAKLREIFNGYFN